MKIPKSIKRQAKEMKRSILERMEDEQRKQADLRIAMNEHVDNEIELKKIKVCFDESVKHWEVLNKSLIEYDKLSKSGSKISPDAILAVMGNLAGILLILNFEKIDIIRSKAISFVLKGKL